MLALVRHQVAHAWQSDWFPPSQRSENMLHGAIQFVRGGSPALPAARHHTEQRVTAHRASVSTPVNGIARGRWASLAKTRTDEQDTEEKERLNRCYGLEWPRLGQSICSQPRAENAPLQVNHRAQNKRLA